MADLKFLATRQVSKRSSPLAARCSLFAWQEQRKMIACFTRLFA
jgi:hypothetical protein